MACRLGWSSARAGVRSAHHRVATLANAANGSCHFALVEQTEPSLNETYGAMTAGDKQRKKTTMTQEWTLVSLLAYPERFACSGCGCPVRSASAGLALSVRTRWRWADGAHGPVILPNNQVISITEAAEACSGACFDAILTSDEWLPISSQRRLELVEHNRSLLFVRGEFVIVHGGAQTIENVARVLAAKPSRAL